MSNALTATVAATAAATTEAATTATSVAATAATLTRGLGLVHTDLTTLQDEPTATWQDAAQSNERHPVEQQLLLPAASTMSMCQ
jgi:hypothetical protein